MLAVFLFNCQPTDKPEGDEVAEVITQDTTVVDTVEIFHGIRLENSVKVHGKIRWNQTLSDLLDDYNVTPEKLYALDRNSREVYDVRKLKAGSKYVIIKDTLRNKATNFVFDPDALSTVIYHLDDTVMATAIQKPVHKVSKSIAVEIQGSVYESVLQAGGSPLLSSKLGDILAWQ